MHIHHELDTRGKTCPLPVLKLSRLLASMQPGELVRVVVSDAESARDVPRAMHRGGHELVESVEAAGEWTFTIRRAEPTP